MFLDFSSCHSLQVFLCSLIHFCCTFVNVISILIGCLGLAIARVWLKFILELRLVSLVECVAVVCYHSISPPSSLLVCSPLVFSRLPISLRATRPMFPFSPSVFPPRRAPLARHFNFRPFCFPFCRASLIQRLRPVRCVARFLTAFSRSPFRFTFRCAPFTRPSRTSVSFPVSSRSVHPATPGGCLSSCLVSRCLRAR